MVGIMGVYNFIYEDINLFFDGNSLTQSDQDGSVAQYMPLQVKQSIYMDSIRGMDFNSIGVGGQKIQTMVNNYAVNVAPHYDAAKDNYLIVCEGENGFDNDFYTGQDNLNLMNQYIALAKATGWNVISWGAWYKRTPYSPADNAIRRSNRKDYLNLAANEGLNSDYHLDMRTLDHVGGVQGLPQDPIYNVDWIHLTAAGYDIVAKEITRKLQEILPKTVPA